MNVGGKLASCLLASWTVGVGVLLSQGLSGRAFFLTSLISSSVLVASNSGSRACHPLSIAASHFIAIACGLAVQAFLPFSPQSIALAVVLALLPLLLLDAVHPPALANVGIVYVSNPQPDELLIFTMAAVSVLVPMSLLCTAIFADNSVKQRT